MYKQHRNLDGTICDVVIVRIADNAFIPADKAVFDYQEYLRWLEEGNEPLPADEPEVSDGT